MIKTMLAAVGVISMAFAGAASAADEAKSPESADVSTTYLVSMTGVT